MAKMSKKFFCFIFLGTPVTPLSEAAHILDDLSRLQLEVLPLDDVISIIDVHDRFKVVTGFVDLTLLK